VYSGHFLHQNGEEAIRELLGALVIRNSRDTTYSKLIFSQNGDGNINLEKKRTFLSEKIISIDLLENESNLLVMPLFVVMDFIGYIVFEPSPALSYTYSMVQRYVSSAIYGAIIVRERIFTEQRKPIIPIPPSLINCIFCFLSTLTA
jgi:hypothetical protein